MTDRPKPGEVEERSAAGLTAENRKIRGIVPYNTPSRDMGGWTEDIEPTAFRQTDFSELRAVIDHKGVPLARYPEPSTSRTHTRGSPGASIRPCPAPTSRSHEQG